MDILHTALWVTNLDETPEFYMDVCGLEYSRQFVGHDGVTNYYLTGESETELQFKYDESADVTVDPGTMDHIAVKVPDVDNTLEYAVEEWDSTVTDGPRNMDSGLRVAFLTDPEGYTVEIIEEV